MIKEKEFNPSLWISLGIKQVQLNDDFIAIYESFRKINSFLDYQASEDTYEVRRVMPSIKKWRQQDLNVKVKNLTLSKKK